MALPPGSFQFPAGFRTVNPVPVDYWSGPFTGDTLAAALTAANQQIPVSARFRSLEVRIIVGSDTYKYWYYGGTANSDLVEFIPAVPEVGAEGPERAIQFNDSGSFSGSGNLLYNSTTQRLVLGSDVLLQFGDGTTQGTARNFYSLTGATSSRYPKGISGAGNTGDRLLIATGPSADPFKSYVRFGNAWFQTGVVGIGQGPQGIQGATGATGIQGIQGIQGATGATGVQGERGATGSFTGNYVSTLNGLTGNLSLTAGTNVSIGVSGSIITISASGGSAETTWGRTDPTTVTVGGVASGSTFDVSTNAVQVLHQILYPYVSVAFTSFNSGLNYQYEIGQTAGGSVSASWSRSGSNSNWVASSAYIRYTGLASGAALTAGNPLANSAAVLYPSVRGTSIGSSMTVSLTAQQIGGTPIVTAPSMTSTWWSKMYAGKSSNADLRTQSFDVSGNISPYTVATSSTAGPSNLSVTVGAGDGYFYLFIHDYYTLNNTAPYFGLKYSGFPLAQDGLTSVTLTNAQGLTATYKRYKSLNRLNDTITIDINPSS